MPSVNTVKQMKVPAGTEGDGDTGIADVVLVGESVAISATHASSAKTGNTPTSETFMGGTEGPRR